ncbi:MAG: pantoate--beta-alanine ligase [Planctomycetes bacterium]|jgi:pantoate--beta-alanine ligase|nr:pantoate--beta-alanine ligase [Planctomycetota bacterium]
MQIAATITEIRALVSQARKAGRTVGFVPTMGALHAGHVALIQAAVEQCDFVVVSLFVNPTQFGPGEDFEKYPRPLDQDLALCRAHGADAVFAPGRTEMYPRQNLTWVSVEKVSEPLCGRFRPGHFRGVATVCTKLFSIVGPDLAFFGQKDAQQVAVIQRMVADLNLPLEIVVCPTVREPDGLALSSRNQYLSPQERKEATVIYRALCRAAGLIRAGETDVAKITEQMHEVLRQVPALRIEYASVADAESLAELRQARGRVLVAVAGRLGSTRLIDNVVVDVGAH